MHKTELGKINAALVGMGGRDDGMFGVTFHLETTGGSVVDFWRLDDQTVRALEVQRLMISAGVKHVSDLAATPIEAHYEESGKLMSWRVLTEVL